MPKSRPPAVCMGLLFVGIYAAMTGFRALRHWPALAAAAQLYYGVSLLVGACAAGFGAWQMARRQRGTVFRWTELAEVALLATNQIVGVWFKTFPCATPG